MSTRKDIPRITDTASAIRCIKALIKRQKFDADERMFLDDLRDSIRLLERNALTTNACKKEEQSSVPNREPDGQWDTIQSWIANATSDIGGLNAACYDARGRRVLNGYDFMLARDENAFPVRYWYGEGGQTPKEQREAKKRALATMKINYPWRYK